MDIQINLLPDELRPRPPVETRTLLLVFLIVALIAGAAMLYVAKSGVDSDRMDMEARTASMVQEAQAVSSDSEAVALTASISRLKTMKKNFDAFVAARIDWGDALERVNALVPEGIELRDLTQAGNKLVIEGRAPGYNLVASYARALDIDRRFTLAGVPYLQASGEGKPEFGVIVKVAPGGGA